jgi:hypothetical protein
MLTRTWAVFVDRGAVNPTFSGKAIIEAHKRAQEYWAVDFKQDLKKPQYRYILTTQRKPQSWLAWTQGNSVRYPTYHKYGYAQLVYISLHETGHLITGGNRHAKDKRNVMFAAINDVYKNFHQEDSQWFRFSWKSNRRPWNEPDIWRPKSSYSLPAGEESDYLYHLSQFDPQAAYDLGYQPCEVGCVKPSFWETVKDLFAKRDPVYIEEE